MNTNDIRSGIVAAIQDVAPEVDYAKLTTLDTIAAYIATRLAPRGA